MVISSPAFGDGEQVPEKYACDGENISPPLQFSGVPDTARSLVLCVTDPDAPARPWVHWLVFNIPADVSGAGEGTLPAGGTEGLANGGTPGYEGPCPPEGTHRYVFTLYALDTKLDISASADRKTVLPLMEGHTVSTATLTGVYAKHE